MLKSLGQEMKSRIPVLVLTAKDQLEHKLHGFPTGADDYVVKPVALAELEMRLRVLVQRTHSAMAEPQALRNSAKQGGGQGLGLFLTRGVCERFGWTLTTSANPSHGTLGGNDV